MKLVFFTPRNINGNRRYLILDTTRRQFARDTREMAPTGTEIRARDLDRMRKAAEADGYTETERL